MADIRRPAAAQTATTVIRTTPPVSAQVSTQVSVPLTLQATAVLSRAQVLTNTDARLVQPKATFTPLDIGTVSPLVGIPAIRTVSIAKRLEDAPSAEARSYAIKTRHEALQNLLRLADQLTAEDGGTLPGLFDGLNLDGIAADQWVPEATAAAPNPVAKRPFSAFLDPQTRNASLSMLLAPRPVPQGDDQSSHFSDAAGVSDSSVSLLRQMEGRIKLYRDLIALCQTTLDNARGKLGGLNLAIQASETALAEARHDTATALALQDEEQARLDAINTRRQQVLDSEVRFLAYIRPREIDNLKTVPSRVLDPGLAAAPVPECLRSHTDVPDELQQLLAVVREAPAGWFIGGTPLLDRLDRIELLGRTMQAAQQRGSLTLRSSTTFTATTTDKLGAALTRVSQRQTTVVSTVRATVQQVDLSRYVAQSWQIARAQAEALVSFGDLIDGQHGRDDVARRAALEFAQIGEICTCLHAEFCSTLPVIRLGWADTLGEYDATPSLRNLAGLPRWNEISYLDRRRMQAYVDWLFGQIRPGYDEASGLINDLVHACLLLASHAPVDRIIAGRLPRPVVARPGVRIPLTAFDSSRLRIGMHALIYRGDSIVARAVVDDLGSTEHMARVLETRAESEQLDTQLRVHFADAASVSALRLRR